MEIYNLICQVFDNIERFLLVLSFQILLLHVRVDLCQTLFIQNMLMQGVGKNYKGVKEKGENCKRYHSFCFALSLFYLNILERIRLRS